MFVRLPEFLDKLVTLIISISAEKLTNQGMFSAQAKLNSKLMEAFPEDSAQQELIRGVFFFLPHVNREEKTSKLKEVRFDKPIILRHYGDHREKTFSKTQKFQTGMTVTPELTYGKPQIPVVKKADTAQRKLHYGLNDGSSFI